MTPQEARGVLGLGEGAVANDDVRGAYLRRVRTARLEVDPEGFVAVREAFELLSHGGGAPASEVTAAREELAGRPDDVDTRWWLLSYLPYATGLEAFSVLCDGATRQPAAFLDELLFHFSEKVPAETLASGAAEGAGLGRLLLLADVHATQGRPGNAVETLRTALTAGRLSTPALIRLALRPLFSLQAHAQLAAAGEALALVKQRLGDAPPTDRHSDLQTATILALADDLGRLGDALPLDLRQAAARAARRGSFADLAYDARYAIRLMKPRQLKNLNDLLRPQTPTLAGLLSLQGNLASPTTPDFRLRLTWGAIAFVLATFVVRKGCVAYHRHRQRQELFQMLGSINNDLLKGIERDIDKACADPESPQCQKYRTLFENGDPRSDADQSTASPDAGLE